MNRLVAKEHQRSMNCDIPGLSEPGLPRVSYEDAHICETRLLPCTMFDRWQDLDLCNGILTCNLEDCLRSQWEQPGCMEKMMVKVVGRTLGLMQTLWANLH